METVQPPPERQPSNVQRQPSNVQRYPSSLQRHHSVHVTNEAGGQMGHGLQTIAPANTTQNFSYNVGPAIDEDDPKFKSDIEKASILSQLNFIYVFPVMWKAWKGRKSDYGLRDPDLLTFPYRRRADTLADKFMNDMERQKQKKPNKKPNLTMAIIRSTKWTLLRCLVVAIIFSFVRIFTGWVLKELIDSYSTNDDMWQWSVALSICLLLGLYFEHHYNHIGTYFPTHVRGGIIDLIYKKTTKLSLYTLTKVSPGQIINLASNDVNVFDEFGVYFPKSIVAPIVLIASGALLWHYFGVLCLVGLGYICMWFPLQTLYIVKNEAKTEERNHITDERVQLTRESLEGIRLLKMYTWELRFKDRIFDFRNKEVSELRKNVIGESIWRGISFSSLAVSSFLIFMPVYLTDRPLTPGTVFSTFYLFCFIRLYGAFFVNQGLVFLVAAHMVIKRTEKLLETPEIGTIKFDKPKSSENAIEFENFTGFWTKEEDENPGDAKITINPNAANRTPEPTPLPTLIDVTATLKKGSLTALVGPVGSGKTSFLMSLTGEMPKSTGALRYDGTIAYVEQEPTIFAGTFRESICFGKPYDEDFYNKVIKACNLETDLSLFPNGDMSEIGEKGNNLSGGQKARLALARGVYANADIYLLDDPLSAVDPKVALSLFENCISGLLKGKTVILVTHQVDFAKRCDQTIFLKGGEVRGSGPLDQLQEKEPAETAEAFRVARKRSIDETAEIKPRRKKSALLQIHKTLRRHASDHQTTINEAAIQQEAKKKELVPEKVQEEEQADPYPGKVSGKTYKELLKGMGNPLYLFILLAAYIATEMAIIAYGRMLAAWLTNDFPYWKSLAILGGLVGFIIFIYFAKYILLNLGLVKTSKVHHEKMLNRIIQAPVYFFDSNPIGNILNRFSNDVGTLDRFLSLICMDVLDNVFFIFTVIITVSIIDPVHLAPLAGEVIFIFVALTFCYHGVQQTKKYDLATRGPLFSLFSSSLSGIVIIRSYNQGELFQEKFKHQLHSNIKGSIGFALTSRFLAFCCDFGYNLAEIGVIFIMAGRNRPDSNFALEGFSLALILSVSGILQYTLRQICMGNILAESAARVQSYWGVPNEAPLTLDGDRQLQEQKWPQKGEIDFNRVYMKYSPTGPDVIKGLTLHADPGQRIGCVGRTGAGKTSILQLLFRLQEINKESDPEGFIKIDNVDTSTIGLHELRGNISIIPQTPFILSGTVRYNVDPLKKATDDEIWKALKDVRLKKHVETLPHKLDTEMTAATSVFSVGQKQLVCLARSILKPSPIMIMDEATANMDQETDEYVTNKIRETFTHSTTFTIAHRLITIANYDRVLVLDKGQIKEFDEPYKLLVKNVGDDQLTNDEGHFASMVKNTGPITSKHIFEVTKKAYEERRKTGGKPEEGGRQDFELDIPSKKTPGEIVEDVEAEQSYDDDDIPWEKKGGLSQPR